MEHSDYWEKVLANWDGSTKQTFNSNKESFTSNTQLPSMKTVDYELTHEELEKQKFSQPTEIDYKIIERIGSGGMGAVFKGYQECLEREVAIKKLLAQVKDPVVKEKFVAESKITAYLSHPNIVPVYEIGVNKEKEVMLVMHLVGGSSWKKLLRNSNTDLEKHLQILLSVINAIAFAHSKNIVHNDLKPDNVMVGEFGEVLVMDWGLAVDICEDEPQKQSFPHKSIIKTPAGTPGYMAPELAFGKGQNIGSWTDVYLLGGILYEILMGAPPHRGNSYTEILTSILKKQSLLWKENIPEELQNICHKAMSQDIKKRYQNVTEFGKDIESFLQHRESIIIAEDSQKILKECKKKIRNSFVSATKLERQSLYEDYSMAISGFYQAIKLWPKNQKAIEYEKLARLEYAKVAVEGLDFGLAQAQLKKLDANNKEVKVLQEQIKNSQELQECNLISKKLQAFGLFVCVSIVFRFLLSVVLPPQDKLYFMQNNPATITASLLMFIVSLAWVQLLRNQSFRSLRSLFRFAVLYEAIGVFLVALIFSAVHFEQSAVPTGTFLPCIVILLFRVIVPYPTKLSLIAGFISASVGVATLFLTKYFLAMPPLPELLLVPYIVEHYMMAIIGVFLSKMLK